MDISRQPVSNLKGIGPQSVAKLDKLGIHYVQDLLFHLPHRYLDKTRCHPIASLTAGQTVLIAGIIEAATVLPHGKRHLIITLNDDTAQINLRFFHYSAAQLKQLKPGVYLACFGEIRAGYQGLEMTHPEYSVYHSQQVPTEERLTPVYPSTEGLRQATLRKAIQQALASLNDQLQDFLPDSVRERHGFPPLQQALETLHSPLPAQLQQNTALKRLAFEELLAHHLKMLQGKQQLKQWQAPLLTVDTALKKQFLQQLPFQLTAAQQRVIAEIERDCQQTHPMLRLVQGDVGSGKTLVAACAALMAHASNFQTAIMAPTELLAEQHLRNFSQWFSSLGLEPFFLSGQLKGKKRQQTLKAIQQGEASIIIGTHALFQEQVEFARLGLIIIDEQHRFGVHQRLALREKARSTGLKPHQLVMTATPIPRTLAMLQYSDLDISVIDELPPGRKPVTTRVLPSSRRDEVIDRIRQWAKQNHQSYWVCTLIEESEALQCEAAEKTVEYLQQALPGLRIALVHGRLKAAEKEQIMHDFKQHHYDLLVATTVIEVGVDVPNASLMIIENAERLGLSQLHQLRGRVGRGSQESYCLLLYQPPLSDTGKQRLGILRESNDGFVIAEKDLAIRGPGEVLGTRQTGQIQFRIADLGRDQDLLDAVQQAGNYIITHQPDSVAPLIERWLSHHNPYAEV